MSRPTPRTAPIALALCLIGPALAQPPGAGALLAEWKALESESHRARIRLLQDAEACIQATRTFKETRACERKEQQAREALREAQRPRREALRAQAEARRGRLAGRDRATLGAGE